MELNVKSLAISTISVIIVALLTITVLVPICNDAVHAGAPTHDNGNIVMELVDGRNVNMILTNTNQIYTNSELIQGYGYNAIVSDGLVVAVNNGGVNIFYNGGWAAITGANVFINASEKTISLTDITHNVGAQYPIEGDAINFTYSQYCAYRAETGSYAYVAAANLSTIQVNDASQIRGTLYSGGSTGFLYSWQGETVTENGALAEDPATIVLAETSNENINSITSVTYQSVSPAWYVVPLKVYGESYVPSEISTIVNVIPLIFLAGLVIGVVARFVSCRD